MFKKLFFLCAFFITNLIAQAQTDSSRLRISLLTCGTGPEVWETFGHTAIRVIDSVNGTDNVYNFGTFAFSDDFALQFMRGKLLYNLSFYPYAYFLPEYTEAKRSVEEQVLLLDGAKKQEFYEFLKENAKEENRYYKYDFFFDNCATRIRDVFPKSLNGGFQFGKTIAADKRITFRNIINRYYYAKHWERFGINILLGSRIDAVMTNEDIMFLPDYLRDGVAGATLNGKRISTDPVLLIPGSVKKPAGVNGPLMVMLAVFILTVGGLWVRPQSIGAIMQFLVLFVTGLLGCLILVMWFGTDHQGCQNNLNILWALPTNLLIAFTSKKNKGKYAIIAIGLILLALILHIFKIQELPLFELWPLLLSLLFIFGTIYKKSKVKS